MRRLAFLCAACVALGACSSMNEPSQVGEDRYRLATWNPLVTYDEAADMFGAKAVEVCPQGHYVVSEETRHLAVGSSYAWVVRCVDYSDVKRPVPRPPGGP